MKKKVLSIIIALVMVVGMVPATAVVSLAGNQEPVEYMVCVDGINQVWETRTCTEYTVIDEHNMPTEWREGWYVCDGAEYSSDIIYNRIELGGDVHLILRGTLRAECGIEVESGDTFSVYEAVECTGEPLLFVSNNRYDDASPLGSSDGDECGVINFYGGTVNAYSISNAAAVGGGIGVLSGANGGTVTVYGGNLSAISKNNGAAIGGGYGGDYVPGGNGGSLIVYGGEVYAEAEGNGAAIGGGGSDGIEGGDGCYEVIVYDGKVKAIARGDGAAIGGGNDGGDGGKFSMYGGNVEACSFGGGAAIGGGKGGDTFESEYWSFGLYGGTVHAEALGNAPAFGHGVGGDDEDGAVIVSTDCAWINLLTNEQFDFDDDRTAVLGQDEFWLEVDSTKFPVAYQTVSEDRVIENKVCKDYYRAYWDDSTWNDGWYVLEGTGTSFGGVTVTGDVHLILMNGCDAVINGGIKIENGSTLTVHQQPQENGIPAGKLTATGKAEWYPTGIYGSLILCGGDVTAQGASGAVGYGGDLTLYGGSLNARGGAGSVAIGGGYQVWGGDLKFYSGSVTAVAGSGASHAIGSSGGSSTDCTIILGESTVLVDSATGQQIKRTATFWNDVLDGASVSFKAVGETSYREYNSDIGYFDTKTCLEYTTVSEDVTSWTDGWYVQNQGDITITEPITVDGEVCLILGNDTTMNLTGGINITSGSSLTVFAQTENSHKGKLNISNAKGAAVQGGRLTVSGGSIALTGGTGSAAIAGGCMMVVNGGSISATAGSGAANAIECSVLVGGQYMLLDSTTSTPITMPDDAQSWREVLSGSSVSFNTAVITSYLEYSADGKSCEKKETIDYKLIDGSFSTLNTGWYLASGTLRIDGALTVNGDAKIILADGCKLTVDEGICVNEGNSLTVFAQSEGDKAGKLIANGDKRCAGIGGIMDCKSGNITIHGGKITATGGDYATQIAGGAGIGGGNNGDSSPVVIYGGDITANGGTAAAGIGGGYGGWCGDVTIYGGTVKAVGGNFAAQFGVGGAGIGGGATNSENWYSGGCDNVTVYGGKVEAIGGQNAPGIGGGYRGSTFNSFSIYGGTVEATGGKFATGLGNGVECVDTEVGDINIFGGTLIARAGSGYSRVMGYSDGAVQDGSVNIGDGVALVNNINNTPIICNHGQSWLEAINAAASSVSDHYVISVSTLGGSVEILPTCTENGHKAYYYDVNSGIYYEDAGHQNRIGDLAELVTWLADENGGLLPAKHVDEDGDYFCDVCRLELCEHKFCMKLGIWNDDYTECRELTRCYDCNRDISQRSTSVISFIYDDDEPKNCITLSYGYYTAVFSDSTTYNSGKVGKYGPHSYVDFVCEYCRDEQLNRAKVFAKDDIDKAAGNNPGKAVTLLVNAAKAEIDAAEKVANVTALRDEWVAEIEKLEHTYSLDWSYDESYHWHASTCGHVEVVNGFAAHTFGEDGKCTVCGCESGAKICTVTLASVDEPDTVLYSGTTDGTNLCNIVNVANGTYLMSVACEGAVTRTYTTEITDGKVTQEVVALYAEGDVNGDGEIDVNDFALAVNSALGENTEVAKDLTETEDYQKAVADLDGDGFVDVLDLVLLERKIY